MKSKDFLPAIPWRQIIGSFSFSIMFFLPFLAFGTEGAEEGRNWRDFFWRTFDFAVLVGLIYWLVGAKVRDFFHNRKTSIKDMLDELERKKNEAKSQYEELERKLEKGALELEELEKTILLRGREEKERIIQEALLNAQRMKEEARRRMEYEMKRASMELKAEAVRLSIEIATKAIARKITQEDHRRLVMEYIREMAGRN